MAAGGERGVMSRTMHKTYFKKDSPVLFSFVLCFDTKVYKYRSTGTLLTEKAGKCGSWRYGSTKTRQERLTFCFFLICTHAPLSPRRRYQPRPRIGYDVGHPVRQLRNNTAQCQKKDVSEEEAGN